MSVLTAKDLQSELHVFVENTLDSKLSGFATAVREGVRDDLQRILTNTLQASHFAPPGHPHMMLASSSDLSLSTPSSMTGSCGPALDSKSHQVAMASATDAAPQQTAQATMLRAAGKIHAAHAMMPQAWDANSDRVAVNDNLEIQKGPPLSTSYEAEMPRPSTPHADMVHRIMSAKKKMGNIRTAIPATPVVAEELKDLGYFKEVAEPGKINRPNKNTAQAMMLQGAEEHPLHSKTKDYQDLHAGIVSKIVRSDAFEGIVLFVICLNAVFIGIETNAVATDKSESASRSSHFAVLEILFMVIFIVELGLRIFVFRCWFCKTTTPLGRTNPNLFWNVFDTFLVAIQIFDNILKASVDSAKDSVFGKATILRFLRVLRLARLLRVGKVIKFFRPLRTIVHSITYSLTLFMSALGSMILMNFLFAVYVTEVVSADLHKEAVDPDLKHHFGSIMSSMLSVVMGATGGIDWGDLYTPLMGVSRPFAAWPFFLYEMFLLIVTLNVFTGVILDSVQKRDRQENELELVANAYAIFNESDSDGSGTITRADFQKGLATPELKRLFKTIDLDVRQAEVLFDLLDMSNDGFISCGEFLRGCMRLQGTTKALDLLILSREVTQTFDEISDFIVQTQQLLSVLLPGLEKLSAAPHEGCKPNCEPET